VVVSKKVRISAVLQRDIMAFNRRLKEKGADLSFTEASELYATRGPIVITVNKKGKKKRVFDMRL